MSFFKIFASVKPMYRKLSNGRVIEYFNFGNGVTKSRILRGKQEILNRTAMVNRETGERFISEISNLLPGTSNQYFKHAKINCFYDDMGNFLKRTKLLERGIANPASEGNYCRTSDVSLLTQKSNGLVSEIQCWLPDFRYTKFLDTTSSIFKT